MLLALQVFHFPSRHRTAIILIKEFNNKRQRKALLYILKALTFLATQMSFHSLPIDIKGLT